MGPYDNEAKQHIFDPRIMDAHWFQDRKGHLLILPREGDSFDEIGGISESVDTDLFFLDDQQLDEFDPNDINGIDPVPGFLRRFDEDAGYFVA